MLELIIVLAVAIALAWPLGHYLARVLQGQPGWLDPVMAPVERYAFRALRTDPRRGMTWRGYARAFVGSNLALAVVVFLILLFQHRLPLNPDAIGPLRWDTALHTMISFLTNTNQQHYSGQSQLSYLSQLAGLVTLQVVTPMMGLAVAAAMLRGFFGGRNATTARDGEPRDVGNFYVDLVRLTLRVFLPLGLLVTAVLVWQGVPSTFRGAHTATPIDAGADMAEQRIVVGPVAAMVAVKQLGTNGGGWYGPNSAVPLENPTPLSNLVEMVSILLLPMAVVFMLSRFTGRPRLTPFVFATMLVLSLLSIGAAAWSEAQPNAAVGALAAGGANMEGKEVRFGAGATALWAAATTQTSNGSVNGMHDSLNPLTGAVALGNMLVNSVWGGVGCGLVNFFVFVLAAVFLAGLMIGRTPELFGRKLEVPEIRLLSLAVLLPPLCILGASALAFAQPALTGSSNPGFHGVAQVLYEYTSAFANNGSGFEGLADGTPWWNLSCVVLLLVGRYAGLLVPLAIAGRLATKRVAPTTSSSLQIETPTFALTLVAVIGLLTLLCFLPALLLGPLGEALAVAANR
jgi:K+-transporting ATPase ATPase A chain